MDAGTIILNMYSFVELEYYMYRWHLSLMFADLGSDYLEHSFDLKPGGLAASERWLPVFCSVCLILQKVTDLTHDH